MFHFISISEKGQTHALPISVMSMLLMSIEEAKIYTNLIVWVEKNALPAKIAITSPEGQKTEINLKPEHFALVPFGSSFEAIFKGHEPQHYWVSGNGSVQEGNPEPTPIPADAAPGYEKAAHWLLNGQTGLSSKTMCFTLFPQLNTKESYFGEHPHDPSDLHRCVLFLQAVPEARERLGELSAISPTWKVLIENWADLEKTLLHEMENDVENYPTYEKMNALFATIPRSTTPKM